MAQFGEKVWFRKIGEDGVSSCASRMTQGNFVGHCDRTGTVLCITKNAIVRGKSWTRPTLKPDRVQYLFLSSVIDAHSARMAQGNDPWHMATNRHILSSREKSVTPDT